MSGFSFSFAFSCVGSSHLYCDVQVAAVAHRGTPPLILHSCNQVRSPLSTRFPRVQVSAVAVRKEAANPRPTKVYVNGRWVQCTQGVPPTQWWSAVQAR
jgi:hypothetical protein